LRGTYASSESVNLFVFRFWEQDFNDVFQISEVIEENYPIITETPKRKPLLEIFGKPSFESG